MAHFFQGHPDDFFPSLALMNNATRSASADEATTHLRIPNMMKITPFNLIGFPFTGVLLIKNSPAILLLAHDSERYNASE